MFIVALVVHVLITPSTVKLLTNAEFSPGFFFSFLPHNDELCLGTLIKLEEMPLWWGWDSQNGKLFLSPHFSSSPKWSVNGTEKSTIVNRAFLKGRGMGKANSKKRDGA